MNKASDPYWKASGDVYPTFIDDSNFEGRIIISGKMFDDTGNVADGKGSLDDQIYRLYELMTDAFYLLKLRVYYSGASDYTDYTGHFKSINVKLNRFINAADYTIEFAVCDGYLRI